ncbi:MAG: cytochrome c [Phototrophicales bacterium]
MRQWLLLIPIFMILTACSGNTNSTSLPIIDEGITPTPLQISALISPRATQVLLDGESNYYIYCAHCHGYEGEGQLESTIENTLSLGLKTVPAHDSTGHTWMHPDALLVQVIRDGIDNPLNHFPMPGFGEVLSDEEIMQIINFMKHWWTEEQLAYQAEVNQRWNDIHGDS